MPNFAPYLQEQPVTVVFILAFVAWWLLGASWLLQRSLRVKAGRRREPLGPCILGMLLAGLAAGAVGGLTFVLVLRVRGETPESLVAARVPAAILGVLLAAPTVILVLYASLQLPLRKVLLVSWPALLSVVVAAGALGTPAIQMARSLRDSVVKATASRAHLAEIDVALREYEVHSDSVPPPDLSVLRREITTKVGKTVTLLKQSDLECPFLEGVPVGYFYYPRPSTDPNLPSQILRVCEWTHSYSRQFRGVLFTNGQVFSAPDQDFQAALNRPENAEFARRFRAADANRR